MARQTRRLATGGLIDRSQTISFSFDGRRYLGHPGDTLASAMVANGVVLAGRSFKYHRPRGILSAGSEEPNALVEVRSGAYREPNTKATTAELYDGLDARSQNRWPSLRYDVMAINSVLAPIFAAGFYYKTFMWPAAFWERLYEPLIRRAAGLGRAADVADPDRYEKVTAFCDVLVIGGGPAGLSAALAAGRAGARVMLADEQFAFGGRCIDDAANIYGKPAIDWVRSCEAELRSFAEVRLMPRTTVFGVYDGGTYAAIERVSDHFADAESGSPRQRLWRIVAKKTVLASGATERPIVFGDNDRPGVMLAGAVRTYINRFGVLPGQRIVIFTNNDDAAKTVRDVQRAGGEIVALVDGRAEPSEAVAQIAEQFAVRLLCGAVVTDALGRQHVTGARIRKRDGTVEDVSCDLIAVSGGWSANIQLTTHLGGKPIYDERLVTFLPGTLPPRMAAAGAVAGKFGLAEALSSGQVVGAAAVEPAQAEAPDDRGPIAEFESDAVAPLWRVGDTSGKAFVDFQNDVTVGDIVLSEREGFRSVEHLKRYTTLGMATDQGRTSNLNALAIMAELTGKSIPQTGMTVARPPYTPVAIGAFAGHHRGAHFKPTRLPPSYDWARENGAVFTESGLWLRPSYFPRPGERDWLETVTREVKTVRSAVGICDVSTLGKIDVQGQDALNFLERVYMNNLQTLTAGRTRYGCMLREDGIVTDDGTIACLADNHFYLTTTTANAGKVFQHLEVCHQVHWPHLDVQITPATEQWAQFAVAGPQSRALLQDIVDPQFDLSDVAFPFMQAGRVTVANGIKGRLFRISFSGERAYEIAVPASYGDALFRLIMQRGAAFGICAYGTEALGVMRIEKGHVGGAEINGTATPHDLGLGGMVSKKKDFIGSVLGTRPGLIDRERPSLIGFRPLDRTMRLRAGAQFVARDAPATAQFNEGYMTSVAFSPTLNHWIGLGLLARGPARIGEVVRACDPLRAHECLVEVVPACFVDAGGGRVRG